MWDNKLKNLSLSQQEQKIHRQMARIYFFSLFLKEFPLGAMTIELSKELQGIELLLSLERSTSSRSYL